MKQQLNDLYQIFPRLRAAVSPFCCLVLWGSRLACFGLVMVAKLLVAHQSVTFKVARCCRLNYCIWLAYWIIVAIIIVLHPAWKSYA
jgi:hypothetical protein